VSDIEAKPAATSAESLRGKTVLITGASSGIGLATAEQFSAAGARVALVARRADRLEALAARLGHAIALPADVSDSEAVDAVVADAWSALGGLDALINAAGIALPTPLDRLTPKEWREVLDINLSGTFYPCRAVGLRMRDAGAGSIVNVGSELSTIGMAMYAPYCASKFGVVGLTKALAAELAPTVRVNVICPGPVDTPMLDREIEWFPEPEKVRVEAVERVPLKRLATAEEIARGIRFLAFDAPFATGTVLPIDGGTTMV
jgi:NAD(P)-dependent dehydrogenase (short-subunit alcohol dehydrogenase family)